MSEPWERKNTEKKRHDHAPLHMRAIVVGGVLFGALMVSVKETLIPIKSFLSRVKTRKDTVE